MHRTNKRHVALELLAWSLAIAAACALDAPVARWVHGSGLESFLRERDDLRHALHAAGEFKITLLVLAVLVLVRMVDWRGAVFVLGACLVSGLNGALKWIVGRTRPFKLFDAEGQALLAPFDLSPFRGGIEGALHQTNLCFPSGHAAWAFASAAALSILLPRWRWVFYAVAVVVGFERIAENAHWTSDVVCAAALGVVSVRLLRWIWWDAWERSRGQEGSHGREALPVAGDPGVQRAGEHPHAADAR